MESRQRDILTLRILGSFFLVMGLLVLVAIYEAIGNSRALVVTICSGVVLALIGLAMLFFSSRISSS